ncbi:acyltransferase [Oceanobacillus sojae]|uniref:acyltransferase n=1 Tax=Oceanobacillus sojae TaxID=582851 RepID=UPI0021A9057C|nr:acyltransferase [Oceanobacillus sojae]MCT1901856.1 acyltransferase [Oceanobacillus sojae]
MKLITYLINFFFRDIPIHLINLVTALLPNHIVTNRIRGFLMKPFFGKCGKRLQVGKGVILNNPGSLYLGNDCYISHYCYLQAKGKVILENNVIIGPMSVIASSNHVIEKGVVSNKGVNKPIYLGEGTWCGGHVIITAGCSIGKSTVIGAGSVVTKDIPDHSRVFGIPAVSK